jgi:hypothetical protein
VPIAGAIKTIIRTIAIIRLRALTVGLVSVAAWLGAFTDALLFSGTLQFGQYSQLRDLVLHVGHFIVHVNTCNYELQMTNDELR